MTTLLLYVLGTTYLCHLIQHLKVSGRARRTLRIIALLGAALGALGYYGEAVSYDYDRIQSLIKRLEQGPSSGTTSELFGYDP